MGGRKGVGSTSIVTLGTGPTGGPITAVNPLSVNGDSVYTKDIDLDVSDNGGFSGEVTDYFDSLTSVNVDASATNPKQIKVWLNRTIQTAAIGFGCNDGTKSFSNVKVSVLGSNEAVRSVADASADNTKYNSLVLNFEPESANGFLIEFFTADEVGLSNLIIYKSANVNSRLQGIGPSGCLSDVGVSASGNLRTTDSENGLAIAKGEVAGTGFVHKFGKAPDFDPGDGFVTIWDGADDSGINQMSYVYSTSAAIDTISSSNAGDAVDVEIQGLADDWTFVSQTVTLNGQSKVTLPTPLRRAFRMKNAGASDIAGNVYCYEDTAITGGVPNDSTKVRAIIENGNNQTLMAVYTVPEGKTGYIRSFFAAGANTGFLTTGASEIKLFARDFGGVFRLRHDTAISASPYQHTYVEPEGPFPEKTDIEMRANTTIGASAISAGFDIVLVDN